MKPTVTLSFDSVEAMISFFQNRTAAPMAAVVASSSEDEDDNAAPVATQPNQLDVRGFPHDDRIYSKNKTQNKDGSWRLAKNVPTALVEAVEAELRGRGFGQVTQPGAIVAAAASAPVYTPPQQPAAPVYAAPPATAQQAVAAAASAPVYTPPQQPAAPVYTPPQQPAAPVYTPPQQPEAPAPVYTPPPAVPGAEDFPALLSMLQRGMQTDNPAGGKMVDPAFMQYLLQTINANCGVNLPAITELQQRPDLVAYAFQVVRGAGRAV